MNAQTKSLLFRDLPWRRDARWYVVALQAVVLIVIGAYILIDSDRARDTILQLIGLMLLLTSVVLGAAHLRQPEATLGFFDAFRAGIGATAGVIATAGWWTNDIATHGIRIILGWGLVAYCVIHLLGLVAARDRAKLRPSVVATVVLTLVLGIILLTGSDATSPDRLKVFGILLLGFGMLLAGIAYLLFSRGKDRAATPAKSL
jgi:uncharacterized membrane protein HdeD (DUF308 family)